MAKNKTLNNEVKKTASVVIEQKKTYLPSMSLDDIDKYVQNTAGLKDSSEEKNHALDVVNDMVNLSYDDEFNYNTKLQKITDSALGKGLKFTKLSAPVEVETKVKATSNDLKILLSQSAYGVTGLWVKLIHSGFSVKLKPMNAVAKVNLQAAIANGVITFNRLLSGDIYSSIFMHAEEEIVKTFIDLIDYATFSNSPKKPLTKYIKLKDLNIIKLAVLASMYPNGYDGFSLICGERIYTENKENPEERKESICGRESEPFTLDIEELLYIQNDLTEDEIIQLQKTTKNILSEKEVLSYQENFKYNQPLSKLIDEDLNITITSDAGSIFNYFSKSRKYLEEIILKSNITKRTELEILATMISNTSVGKYYYAISKIETEQHYAEADVIDLNSILTISSNPELSAKVILLVKEDISNSAYTVAVPKYICPSCATTREKTIKTEEDEAKDINDDLVTNINVLNLFFYLV